MTADTVPAADEPSSADLADRLRRLLHARGTSQTELARWIGMDPTALSKCLTGARRWRPDELAAVAAATGVPLGYLRSGRGRAPKLEAGADYRPRAAALDSERRRAQIVAVTADLIARRGIHNVRVADIARQCGTSTGTIHYHFPSKVETLRAALGYYADRLYERLDREFAEATDSTDKLRRLVDVQLPSTGDDVAEWSIWIQSWTEAMLHPELRAEQGRVYARWRDTVVEVVRGCQREGHGPGADAQALASRFTALVDGLAIQVLSGTGDMTAARMRELLLDAFEPHIHLRPAG
ncbi:MAG TPA: TetR/AcrR family transcriptional regulator [Trebonia sp.]|nr:TetR/AcrR family transcriptional regulator [Trebonia sp.]